MLKPTILSILIILATSLGLSATAAPAPTPAGGAGYVDAWTFFGRPEAGALMAAAEYGASVRALGQEFAVVCADTFCDRQYGDLTSVSFDCSIEVASQRVGECVWTFAGSVTTVDPLTGHLAIDKKMIACPVPVTGSAAQLALFLRAAATAGDSGFDGLDAVAVQGSQATLMAALTQCL